MDTLRKPLFALAAAAMFIVLAVELGVSGFLARAQSASSNVASEIRAQLAASGMSQADQDKQLADSNSRISTDGAARPGLAIRYLALVDGILVFNVGLMLLSWVVRKDIVAKVQGITTLVLSIILLIVSVLAMLSAFILLMVMVSLCMAVPFGTIAYLIGWGSFNRGGATATLSVIMFLKLAFAVLLILSHPGFLKNKGLIALMLTAVLCTWLTTVLHGFVPVIFVSITDAAAAVIIAVVAIAWSIFNLVGAIMSVVKAIL